MMEMLGKYELEGSLTNENAGYSLWGFGKKDGKDYFIKQFVEQKYPANDTVSSAARLEKKKKECERFEQRKITFYRTLNERSDGNAVRVEEFFRIESKYYISMRRINAEKMSCQDISKLPVDQIKRLCSIVAHSIGSLHEGGLIHADLKPDNVLITRSASGDYTAKVIDFDSGFLESDPPGPGEAISGDFHYFSPEACASIWGNEVKLTCKMDVFALGVLFHEYFTGRIPEFDTRSSSYTGEAVAKDEPIRICEKLPADVRSLLMSMLNGDPEKRPTAMEVFSAFRTAGRGNPFFTPGDL